ncbi:MAG: citrate synthase [Bacteroidetes bacterium]|nr:citrate synthase [Bacteroidota bacterium]MCB0844206.1 citrate synthase [Bacteroidota bacterium]
MPNTKEFDNTVNIGIESSPLDLPVITGTYDEKGIDISKLLAKTGHVTLDIGFKNTGSTTSTITYIDGDKGVLEHRGYRIEDLASEASFLEVCFLLLKEHLPKRAELDEFVGSVQDYITPPAGIKAILDAMPDDTHPMGMLSAIFASLSGFYPESLDSWTSEEVRWRTIYRLLGHMPGICAYIHRRKANLEYIDPNPSLGYVENFLYMMSGKVDPVVADALDTLLILHADHEQNCSASTVRFVGSSQVNLFASISAGNSALWGPLHGGANQAVLEMLEAIKNDGGDTDKYLDKAKDKNDPFRLMGFGHRVYKNHDPRAKVIKRYADVVLDKLEVEDPVLSIAKGLERAALNDPYFSDRKLFPNVDFYSGIIYRALGIPVDMFTVMFALGRLPGWIAQWKEMREGNEPIGRPRQIYTGHDTRPYIPIGDR